MTSWDRSYHFIGIGGAGMSGLAQILLEKNIKVTGSDIKESKTTQKLKGLGAKVYIGHDANNVAMGTVVVSTAISEDNPELIKAKEMGLPILHRADILAKLMEDQDGICIAGAHGKTTTTGMVSLVLANNGLDPSIVVGGRLPQIDGNAKLGQGKYVIAEADESDGSFLKLHPYVAVVTNIEDDHLDYYGTVDNIIDAFKRFVNKVPPEGLVLLWAGDKILQQMGSQIDKRVVYYGLEPSADYYYQDIEVNGLTTLATVCYQGKTLGRITLNVPGTHNLLNALVAVVIGLSVGVEFKQIAMALKEFKGVNRRFQYKGYYNGAVIVDDYAHHPTELRATLSAAKQGDFNRVVAVFQPHRYSRTQFLYREFAQALAEADHIVLTDIYSAGEKPVTGVTSELILNHMSPATRNKTKFISTLPEVVNYLVGSVGEGDLVMTMGAGDVWIVGDELVERK